MSETITMSETCCGGSREHDRAAAEERARLAKEAFGARKAWAMKRAAGACEAMLVGCTGEATHVLGTIDLAAFALHAVCGRCFAKLRRF